MGESYKPPASAIAAAKKGLAQRKEWGRGGLSPSEAKAQGIDSGVTRARKIASGSVSRHDVRRMSAFNRHRKNNRPDKKMPDGGPTAGTIAWNLWGGTSGVNWAKKKSAAMNAESETDFKGHNVCVECGSDEIPLSSTDGGEQGLMDYYFNCSECNFGWFVAVRDETNADEPNTVGVSYEGFMNMEAETLDYNSFTNDMEDLLFKYSQMLLHYDTEYQSKARGGDGVMKMSLSFIPFDAYFDDVDFDSEGDASDPEIPEIISYQKNKYSMDLVVEYRGRKHDLELMIYQGYDAEDYAFPCDYCEQGGGYGLRQINLTSIMVDDGDEGYYKIHICDPCLEKWESGVLFDHFDHDTGRWSAEEGQLAKALAAVREKSKRYAPTPLRLTKLPHPDQKTLKDFEADWRDLSRDSSGRWLPADDSTVSYDMTDMSWMTPSEYYQFVLEEPLDISDDIEDDTQTIEFQDRFVRYTAMTMSPQVIDALIEENELEIVSDLFADPAEAEGEIAFLKAVKRYQQFSEQYSAE